MLYVIAIGVLINKILNNMIYPPAFLTDDAIGVDFRVYYGAARAFASGVNPYNWSPSSVIPYPMFSVVLCSFMALFDEFQALLLWTWLRTGLVIGAYIIIIFYLRPTNATTETTKFLQKHWAIIGCLICASYDCMFWGYCFGNIQPVVFFLTCLCFAFLLRGKDKSAGCTLAMLCLIKIVPVFLIPALFFIRCRGVLRGWMAFMACYAAVLLLTGWWRWEWYLVANILPALGHNLVSCSVSIPIYIGQVFCPEVLNSPRTFNLISKINMALVFGVSIIAYSVAYFRCAECHWKDVLTTASFTMILMSPAIEPFHFVYLVPALAFLIGGYIEGRHSAWYFLLSILFWLIFLADTTYQAAGIWQNFEYLPIPFYKLFCVLALWLLSLSRVGAFFIPVGGPASATLKPA
jgi:hypothetical protein